MKIRKRSWHHKLYVFGSQMFKDEGNVVHTNLCTYVRRMTLGSCITVGCLSLVCCLIGVINLFTIIFGFGLTWEDGKKEFLSVPFTMPWRGERVSLAWVVIPAWVVGGIGALFWHSLNTNPAGLVVCCLVFGCCLGVLVVRFAENKRIAEAAHLAREYCKAKKEGICPLVEFVDEPEPEQPKPES